MNGRKRKFDDRKLGDIVAFWFDLAGNLIVWFLFLVSAASFAATNSAPADEIPSLRPPHAEMMPTSWEQYGWWVAVGGVALFALLGFIAWFLNRPQPPVVVPPELQARQELEKLRRLPADGKILSRVSQILRRYIIAAFNLSPGEYTTTEFCRALSGHEQIGTELSGAIGDFLRRSDEHKFSPAAGSSEPGAASRALELIELAEVQRAQPRETASTLAANQPVQGA